MSIPHQGLMQHKNWFKKYGLFDTGYKISGDYEMLLRGWPEEEAMYVSDIIVSGMRQGGASSADVNAGRLLLKEAWHAQKKHGISLFRWAVMAAYFRNLVQRIFRSTLGSVYSALLLDLGRKLVGKPAYWRKLDE